MSQRGVEQTFWGERIVSDDAGTPAGQRRRKGARTMKVIFIMSDTFRRDHLGAYGNKWIHTPNLDRLAAESALFEHAYIGSFPTIPNRRDLHLGKGDKGVPFNRWRQIDPDEITLAERLGEKKVASMLITDTANSVTGRINVYKGFTAWAFNRGQEGDPYWLDENVPLEFPVPPHLIRYTAQRWHQVLINRAHRRVETDWFAPGTFSMACDWLERNYKRESFLLWVETFDPHEPWDPPEHYEKMYDPDFRGRRFDAPTYGVCKELGYTRREVRNIRARYAGEVTMVDNAVGGLLRTLEKLGIYDECMIVFTSDHGAYFDYPGDNGMICKATTLGADGRIMAGGKPPKKPLRHFPNFTGVAQIPLIVHLPGQSKGVRLRQIVQPWDLTPTVLEAFGIPPPPDFLGQSLIPVIEGKVKKVRDVAVLGAAHAEALTPRWLYAVWRGLREPCLYDLKADPAQKRNVASRNPDVVKRLHTAIVRFLRREGLDEDLIASYE
ncbi:MAG: sulfatase [Armatimonadota bacterium]